MMRSSLGQSETHSISGRGLSDERDNDGFYTRYSLSGTDDFGWKFAFLMSSEAGDDKGLFICNLDRGTLEVTSEVVWIVPEETSDLSDVVSTYSGDTHILAWIDEGEGQNKLMMARVLPNLLLPDPGGHLVAEGVIAETVVMTADEDGGWISWMSTDGEIFIKRIDDAGLVTGDPILIDTDLPSMHAMIDVTPLGDLWLLTWASGDGPPAYAILNAAGEIQSPGIVQIATGSAYWGLAASSSDEFGFIAWRGGDGEGVYGTRISMAGLMVDQPPILVSSYDFFELQYYAEFRRNLDCEWTGSHFVVQWNSWIITLDEERDDPELRSEDFPVFAQWIRADGGIEYDEPIKVNQGTWPIDIVSVATDDLFVHGIVDEGSEEYLHLVKTDTNGALVGEPIRYYATSELATSILALEGTSSSSGAIFIYKWKAERIHNWWTYLTAVNLDVNGNEIYRGSTTLAHNSNGVAVENWDGVEADRSILIGYDSHVIGSESEVHFKWLGQDEWRVNPEGSEAYEPTLCKSNGNYIAVWVEDHGSARRLYWKALDLNYGGSTIRGEPMLRSDGSQRQPCLIEGPDQILCVFIMALPGSGTGADVYAARLMPDGRMIDKAPILIHSSPENLWNTRGAWDGNNYLLTWTSSEYGFDLYGARVTRSGSVIDEGGSYIGDFQFDPGRPAADEYGHVVVAFNQNKIVTFQDGSTGVHDIPVYGNDLFLANPVPNPTTNLVTISWRNPSERPLQAEILDIAGRRIYQFDLGGRAETGSFAWDGQRADGRPAQGGVYYVRVDDGLNKKTRKFIILR